MNRRWKPRDRVRVQLLDRWGPKPVQARWRWVSGTVREIDTGPRPGVRVDLDRPVNGVSECYATHDELWKAADLAGVAK